MPTDSREIVVVGAGAAGLMAGIAAARQAGAGRVLLLDGAKTLGAKILVAGGGRCNVTHHSVDERAYAGAPPHPVRRVLAAFTVERTVAFFRDLGVELKREPTGKLFPVTDSARTVLDALLRAARDAGAELRHPWRVANIERLSELPAPDPPGSDPPADHAPRFRITRAPAPGATPEAQLDPEPHVILARTLILATGGMALPRSGSDGLGYTFARALGHTTTARIVPALVPLLTPEGHWTRVLSGITTPATAELRAASGKRLKAFTNSTLLTHLGLSGPSILDISRSLTLSRDSDRGASLVLNWLPGVTPEALDDDLARARGPGIARYLAERVPHTISVPEHEPRGMPLRLAQALCEQAAVDPTAPVHALTRDQRRGIVRWAVECPVPITGDRGFTHAEVTAGGVPLGELHLATMASRVCPGLHLCGEILDVDGRIGGFNFQWAWASGQVAGSGAAMAHA